MKYNIKNFVTQGGKSLMKQLTVAIVFMFFVLGSHIIHAEDELPTIGLTPPPPPSSIISEDAAKDENETLKDVKIKPDSTLTDNIKNNETTIDKKDDLIVNLPAISTNIADKIAEGEKNLKEYQKTAGETLADMINSKKNEEKELNVPTSVKRSNAAVFDISGAMLHMSPEQIETILTRRGYKKTAQKEDIPNFIRWRNEEKCRAQGVVGYERIENCIILMAKKDGHLFVERAYYAKYDTQEDIEVRFTSNFTKNKAHYIYYKSNVLINLRGNSQKEFYLKNIKIFDFWKRINQKYGPPDNREHVIWGLGGKKPYLQAGTGKLRLEDATLRDLDYARMAREDKKFMSTGLYNF